MDSTLAVREGLRLELTSIVEAVVLMSIEEAVVLASNDAEMALEASIAHTISSSVMPLNQCFTHTKIELKLVLKFWTKSKQSRDAC